MKRHFITVYHSVLSQYITVFSMQMNFSQCCRTRRQPPKNCNKILSAGSVLVYQVTSGQNDVACSHYNTAQNAIDEHSSHCSLTLLHKYSSTESGCLLVYFLFGMNRMSSHVWDEADVFHRKKKSPEANFFWEIKTRFRPI